MIDTDPTRIDIQHDQTETNPTLQRSIGIAVHGRTRFDMPVITHVEGNLWQGGTETGMVLPDTFMHLVSMYPWEKYTVNHTLRSETYIRMLDSTEQSLERVDDIARLVNLCVADGPTVVLCQAGLNRSGLVTARSLMLRGWTADAAITLLRTQRSDAVLCNPAFEAWLRQL